MSQAAVSIRAISKVYKLYERPIDRLKESLSPTRKCYHRAFFALRDVSFDIQKGGCVGILGRNGSGKSTLLKIITGVLTPTSGTVDAQGRIAALLELGAGFNPESTGMENIYLNGTIMGYTREEMDARVGDILDFAQIGEFIHQPVKMYSSGMFARLAFAVAINVDPDILIVDEALSVGDVNFQSKCFRKFNQFKAEGKTILFVTHSLDSVVKYCDRVVVMDSGAIVDQGAPRDMVDLYKQMLVNSYGYVSDEDAPQEEKMPQAAPAADAPGDSRQSAQGAPWKERLSLNPDALVYGEGQAELIDYGVFDHRDSPSNSIVGGEDFTVRVRVRFNRAVEDPIIAFTIRDAMGIEVTGTNTRYERCPCGSPAAGDVIEVAFRQRCTLRAQDYLLSLGCTHYGPQGLEVLHRIYDALPISVVSERENVGFFNPFSEVTLTKR